jgi:hypothetical protein
LDSGVVSRSGKHQRGEGYKTQPGGVTASRLVAETIDWAYALLALDRVALDPDTVNATLGVPLKYQDDIEKVAGARVQELLAGVQAQS